jgi:NAD-reducing hydrogenase small subunit
MSKVRMATVWLDGCSGCHMSFLDLDETLLSVVDRIDLVYSPLVDHKEFPPDVDVTLVEGAVSNEDDLHKIRLVRERTRVLVALGDCAVNSNVPVKVDVFLPGCPPPSDQILAARSALLEGQIPDLAGKARFG